VELKQQLKEKLRNMEEIQEGKVLWDETLWRYFSTDRFVDFLESSSLYHAAASQFEDIFEGAATITHPAAENDETNKGVEPIERAFRDLRRMTKISCWHRSSYESDAMWKLYAQSRKGVAICTTPELISLSAEPFRLKPEYGIEVLRGGPVEYVDLSKEKLRRSMLGIFYCKHMAFSWEKEFRLTISLRLASEFGVQIPDEGIKVGFDLHRLINRIVLGPNLEDDEKKRIIDAAGELGLEDKVELSTLVYTPRYIAI
jgi:hypothetical protein